MSRAFSGVSMFGVYMGFCGSVMAESEEFQTQLKAHLDTLVDFFSEVIGIIIIIIVIAIVGVYIIITTIITIIIILLLLSLLLLLLIIVIDVNQAPYSLHLLAIYIGSIITITIMAQIMMLYPPCTLMELTVILVTLLFYWSLTLLS